jgi:PadR family transcriptional regulator PadR
MQSSRTTAIDGWIVQLRKGALEYCLMLVLRRGESYGYEIIQALAATEELSVGESTVYPILARLKAEGYLKARYARSAAGPMRRYFSLTDAGRARLGLMDAYWPVLSKSILALKKAAEKNVTEKGRNHDQD